VTDPNMSAYILVNLRSLWREWTLKRCWFRKICRHVHSQHHGE